MNKKIEVAVADVGPFAFDYSCHNFSVENGFAVVRKAKQFGGEMVFAVPVKNLLYMCIVEGNE